MRGIKPDPWFFALIQLSRTESGLKTLFNNDYFKVRSMVSKIRNPIIRQERQYYGLKMALMMTLFYNYAVVAVAAAVVSAVGKMPVKSADFVI